MLSKLFSRLLRRVPAPRSGGRSRLFDPDDFLSSKPDPWHVSARWAVYRFFKWHRVFHPVQMWDAARWFVQRGRRGWADCDTWSLDYYLSGWMPAALRHLKETKHGVPCGMFEGLPTADGDPWRHSDEAFKAAEARWDAVMDKMIAAFEADRRVQEGLYEEELGPYESSPARSARARELEARDEAVFKEGMALLVEHWRSLWD